MNEVTFLYDFGSPNAYLAHRVLPAVAARTGAVFRYQPVLLGGLFKATNHRAPLVASADIPAKTAYIHREIARFVRRHAISAFALNPHFPVNTLMAMRGAVAAGRLGLGEAYVEALMTAMWEQGLKLDDPAVLGGALAAAGLPAEQLFALAQDQYPGRRRAWRLWHSHLLAWRGALFRQGWAVRAGGRPGGSGRAALTLLAIGVILP